MIEIAHREVAPQTVVITLTGKLMLGPEGDEVVSIVERQLAAGTRKFIFDLSGVTVIDSTGIGRFISSFNKIMAADVYKRQGPKRYVKSSLNFLNFL